MVQVMQQHRVHKLVFSSSATVYGDPKVRLWSSSLLGDLAWLTR